MSTLAGIASAFGQPPAILFVDLIQTWRTEPDELTHGHTRPSDFERLYRLGYYHDIGDFRELPDAFALPDHATATALELNIKRRSKPLNRWTR